MSKLAQLDTGQQVHTMYMYGRHDVKMTACNLQADEPLLRVYLGGFAASLWDQVLGLVALIKDDEPIEM